MAGSILVGLLPLTPATKGILDREFFSALPSGAALVNVGCGPHLVDADLVDALIAAWPLREAPASLPRVLPFNAISLTLSTQGGASDLERAARGWLRPAGRERPVPWKSRAAGPLPFRRWRLGLDLGAPGASRAGGRDGGFTKPRMGGAACLICPSKSKAMIQPSGPFLGTSGLLRRLEETELSPFSVIARPSVRGPKRSYVSL